jgi:hypothetical protein
VASGDSAATAAAIAIANGRGWSLRDLNGEATEAMASAVLQRKFIAASNREFFQIPSNELLTLVLQGRPVPAIEEVALRDRDHWRMKSRRAPSKAESLVQSEKTIGVLEQQQGENAYRFRPLTNLMDVAVAEP